MTNKVHPNASFKTSIVSDLNASAAPRVPIECTSSTGKGGGVALTVWRKSLLLNCKGFTVFDGNGNIVFRVDCYVAANRGEIVLMDGHGKALLTIRRKRLSWGDNWLIYEGETTINPKYLAQKQGNFLVNAKTMSLAQVQLVPASSKAPKTKNNRADSIAYHIEGSYAQRNVMMYNNKRQCVAEIKRKEGPNGVALGGDVFKLVIVRPGDIDCSLAMALVILIDQMFGST
ncbi:protein LURP-one-related 8 [Silene latifolia]|uniref:protein LURP-one-related 8 n=1 Tax=Silene latifolia TaxID=37657 RepID=UPI003D785A92